MSKSAAFNGKQTHRINNGYTVLYKAWVSFGIYAECGQCNDNLSTGFTANAVNRTEAAVGILLFGKTEYCFIDCRFDFGICVVIRGKCLHSHTRHIGVCSLA